MKNPTKKQNEIINLPVVQKHIQILRSFGNRINDTGDAEAAIAVERAWTIFWGEIERAYQDMPYQSSRPTRDAKDACAKAIENEISK